MTHEKINEFQTEYSSNDIKYSDLLYKYTALFMRYYLSVQNGQMCKIKVRDQQLN